MSIGDREPVTLTEFLLARIEEDQTEDGVIQGEAPCQTLRILAAVYADHPDYDQGWLP